MWQAGHVHDDRWVFYFYKLAEAVLPWTPLLLCALVLHWGWEGRGVPQAVTASAVEWRRARFFGLTFLLGFLVFYFNAKQQNYYLLPLLPPFALLCGYLLGRYRNGGGRKEELMAWTQLALGGLGGLALITIPLWAPARSFLSSLGWESSVPAGLGFLILHFVCARQWVEGRPLAAVAILGIVAYACGLAWSVHWAHHLQGDVPLYAESARLKQELQSMGPDVRVYAVGVSVPLAMFHLERRVQGMDELAKEPARQTGPAAPQRVLVARRRDLQKPPWPWLEHLDVSRYLPSGNEPLVVVALPRDSDWPLKARAAFGLQEEPGGPAPNPGVLVE
jgi:hypothetical protein